MSESEKDGPMPECSARDLSMYGRPEKEWVTAIPWRERAWHSCHAAALMAAGYTDEQAANYYAAELEKSFVLLRALALVGIVKKGVAKKDEGV